MRRSLGDLGKIDMYLFAFILNRESAVLTEKLLIFESFSYNLS